MSNKEHEHVDKKGFSCPLEIPASVPDDLFCRRFKCPERISTSRFSSPTSGLPRRETKELQECIEAANELLRTIGNPRGFEVEFIELRLRFRALRGVMVRVELECDNTKETIVGKIIGAGKDFLLLDTVGEKLFILYERLCSIRRNAVDEHIEGHAHQELSHIDTCFRSFLVLCFGDVVSCYPFLINLFFGIKLHLLLVSLESYAVKLKVEGEEELILGTLVSSDEGRIQLQLNKNEIQQVNFNKICFISIKEFSF